MGIDVECRQDNQTRIISWKFVEFHRRNPHVLEKIEELVQELMAAGLTRCSMKMIFEKLRWDHYIETQGDYFKLNNNYHAFYTRFVLMRHPEWEGFFHTRESAADNGDLVFTEETNNG